ncbi:MAG TPA: AAA family ATPase [Bryobacteraceae bacterium]|jgi:DNA-binding winged helix-turn-helix (wHTH) protein/tetratricopeptide (TPR) repeat protein|nr:AAA family ATPase [Bryobacteraceae bacterium]
MSEKTTLGSIVRFGGFELDVKAGELRRQGRTVRLQEKPLQLLMLLLDKPTSELVTREEIQEHIWGTSRFLDFEDSLNQAVHKLREALRDNSSSPRFLETVPRRGYRFLVPVDQKRPSVSSPGAGTTRLLSATQPQGITVGRRRELSELRVVLQATKEKGGRLFCISGEPGIGKTTLVETFLAGLAPGLDCRIARGRCSERLSGAEAYLPILEGLESLMCASAEMIRNLLFEVAPSWYVQTASFRSPSVPSTALAANAASAPQEQKKREFLSLLESLTREKPLIFFIDDVHWADVSTVDLLSYVIPHCGSLPVLVMATYRPSDIMLANHPFLEAKLELQTRRLCTELELGSLQREDVEKYIDAEFPGNKFPAEFAAAIVRRTEGSPLFLADLLRDLRTADLISNEASHWLLARPVAEIEGTLPDSVRGMIARKIARLSENHRRLLESASIQGLEFDSAVLAQALGLEVGDIEDSLQSLEERHRIIRFIGQRDFPDSALNLRYAFSHALYQESLYAGIRPTRRATLSGTTAAVLLQRYGQSSGEIAAQVAQLFEAAREWEGASKWFCVAAARAAGLSAYREASELSLRAVAITNKLNGTTRDERLLEAAAQLASARQALSEFEQAILDFTVAAEAAARLGNAEAQIDALCGAAFGAGLQKRTAEMREQAQQAMAVAEATGSSSAKADGILGYERLLAGDLAAARTYLERARPALIQQGALSQATFVTGTVGFLYGLQSEYARADILFTEAMGERMRLASSYADVLRMTWMRGMALANQGRVSDALQTLQEGMRMGEINGERYWFSRIPNTIGWIYSEVLDPESALKYNLDGIAAGQQTGMPEVEANSHINLSNAYTALGDLNLAWRHLSEGRRILNAGGDWLKWRFTIRLELENAYHWLARRDLVKARASAELALAKAEAVLARKHVAWAHKLLADIDLLEGNSVSAATESGTALEITRHYPCPLIEWKILLAARQAALLCGGSDHADRTLNKVKESVAVVADSIRDPKLRQNFLACTMTTISGHNRPHGY